MSARLSTPTMRIVLRDRAGYPVYPLDRGITVSEHNAPQRRVRFLREFRAAAKRYPRYHDRNGKC